ncbi:hypothetical protein QWZ06_24785 [Chryseobacterium tructae]|uniref:SGNH/GDSL hydrolase family protein n=1 Tax=Chryseobacterium tructae TaxID=1037380 RepID=A0ABV7XP41_9FLAO|nr:hypothetical protein [Chryseobacterium tructae]MDN3695217.1 hypothetical protein [Chryseobacterium tructae]
MKKSLLRLAMFSILPLLVLGYAVYFLTHNTDDFYKRFTSPQQNSFILGSSRAALMDPFIMDRILHPKYPNTAIYNYSFTWAHSPYGPKYLESIEKKIKPETKDGVFIVTVEPTALMVDKKKPDSPEFYIENDKSVAKTSMVAISPNIEYLFESYDPSITNELNKKILPPKNVVGVSTILDNGKYDLKIIKKVAPEKQEMSNKKNMIKFQERIDGLKVSENRILYLEKTIEFLKQHGKVMVIRMPVNKAPYSIEEKAFPDFDNRMEAVALKTKVSYINYNKLENSYQWLDEVHLDKKSVEAFSGVVARNVLSH